MRRLITFLSFTLVLVISCQEDITVDIPTFEQKLVANCWFTGNGAWYLKLTKTKNLFDNEPIEFDDNAEVKIFENDSLIEILPYIANGIYGISNGYPAKIGKYYNLEINSKGYPTLKATETLLKEPTLIDLKVDTKNEVTSKNLTGHYASIYLSDNPNSKDYYNIQVYRNYVTPIEIIYNGKKYNPGDTILNDYVHFHVSDLIDKQPCHFSNWFFKDKYLTDSANPIQLLIDHSFFENTICFNFEIYSITESYYNYGSALGRYFSNGLVELNGVAYSYTEPMQIKSNIVNGYGIFASYNGHKIVIETP